MRRSLASFLVAMAACGGGPQKSTTPLAPLTDPKPAPTPQVKTDPKPEPAKPDAPPQPMGPVEITLPAPKVSVKLVSPGKGKRAPLRLAAKAGARQTVEIAMDFAGKQTAPPELGGTQEQVAPTLVLRGDVEVKEVDKDGSAKFQLTVSGTDAKDVEGAKLKAAELKADLVSLVGMTLAGSVGANGAPGDATLHVEKPDDKTEGGLGLVKLSLMPIFPVLPVEPIAVGAKWQVSVTQKVADRLEVTQVTDYELVAHKGAAWTIKGTAKITGQEQEIEKAKFTGIGGSGSSEVTLTDGALVPASTTKLETDFSAVASDGAKSVTLTFHLKQGNAVSSK